MAFFCRAENHQHVVAQLMTNLSNHNSENKAVFNVSNFFFTTVTKHCTMHVPARWRLLQHVPACFRQETAVNVN